MVANWGRYYSTPVIEQSAGARDLLADEMFDLLASQGLHIDVLLDGPKAHQALGEQLPRAKFQGFGLKLGHDFQDFRSLAHVRPLVRPNII